MKYSTTGSACPAKATANKAKATFFVPPDKLKTFDGGTHFDTASQTQLGNRFAASMAKAGGKP